LGSALILTEDDLAKHLGIAGIARERGYRSNATGSFNGKNPHKRFRLTIQALPALRCGESTTNAA
jgi:hypothetical protein